MSKNFELMQEEQKPSYPQTTPLPQPSTIVFPGPELERNARRGFSATARFDSMAQEECLKLVQRIFLQQTPNAGRTVVFAGVDRGNGCSRICVETATILAANTSGSICLVDANFRAPSLTGVFGVPNDRGLSDALLVDGQVRGSVKQVVPSNLWLMPAGALLPGSPALLNSERLKTRVEELRREFDFVLIDAPALNLYSDAAALGRVADGVVVVLQADSTRRESALKGLESMREAGIEILGAVLNRRTFPIPNFVYHRL